MTDSEAREKIIYDFTEALKNAGMQSDIGSEDKARYYRNYIPTSELDNQIPLFLLFGFQDQINICADDKKEIRTMYVNGRVMCSSEDLFSSDGFQELKKKVEEEVVKKGFYMQWGADYIDTIVSPDAPIAVSPFECYKEI